VKLAVVGGGSTYTPELVDGLGRMRDVLPVDELVLVDPAAERLELVGGLGRRILARLGHPATLTTSTDLAPALEGVDAVLLQLRVGGQAARLEDETWPLECGCVGQETTGAGGLAKALRTVPVVLDIAEQVRAAAPDAWVIDFTNPVGIVTRALLQEGHRAVGLCNVAIGFQRIFAGMLGVEPERVSLGHVGLNHLSWERKVLVDGVDRLPEFLTAGAVEMAEEVDMPIELWRLLGAIPSYYLRYYYFTDQVLAQELDPGHKPRAQEVMEIEAGLIEMYKDPNLTEKPELLEHRGGAFYSEAAAQLIASLEAGTGDVHVVDVRNDGAIPGLPDDAVVEIPARIDRDGAHVLPLDPLAPEMLGLVQGAKAYERLAVRAAMSGDREVALKALLANQLVGEYDVARDLLGALLDGNREQLPRFFPEG